jgi:hypothetical protein
VKPLLIIIATIPSENAFLMQILIWHSHTIYKSTLHKNLKNTYYFKKLLTINHSPNVEDFEEELLAQSKDM